MTATPDFMSEVPQPYSRSPVQPGRDVVRDRHGVQVAGEHHAAGPAEVGAGEHDVAVPLDAQSGSYAASARCNEAGEVVLVARDRGDVDQGGGQGGGVRGEIELVDGRGGHDRDPTRACGRTGPRRGPR